MREGEPASGDNGESEREPTTPDDDAGQEDAREEEETLSAYSYKGRRLFQTAITVIGLTIIALAARDLLWGEGARPLEDGLTQSKAIEDFNRFLDEGIGRHNIDLFMLAIGSWITFFGLDGILWRGPQLHFDAKGLRYFRFGRQVIPWDAFKHVNFIQRRRTSLLRSSYIDLHLHDPTTVASGQPYLYRAFRRLMHPFDGTVFTIYGYDIEMPLLRVITNMQEVAEGSLPEDPEAENATL